MKVDELVATVLDVAGKRLSIKHVPGPVGVRSRHFANTRIQSLDWRAQVFLREGISYTYPWIKQQVKARQLQLGERDTGRVARCSKDTNQISNNHPEHTP